MTAETAKTATIYHNPACSNSRGALALLRAHGIEPEVIEYLQTPPNRDTLSQLARASGLGLRGLVRDKETAYAELMLEHASDDALLEAMLAHPILINRPLVATPLGIRLCRPPEKVLEIVPKDRQV